MPIITTHKFNSTFFSVSKPSVHSRTVSPYINAVEFYGDKLVPENVSHAAECSYLIQINETRLY